MSRCKEKAASISTYPLRESRRRPRGRLTLRFHRLKIQTGTLRKIPAPLLFFFDFTLIITQKEQPHDKETPLLGICLEKTVIQKVSSFLNERENGKIPRTLSISSDSVHCNTIYRGQNIETSYMSINRVKLLIKEFIFNNHNKHRN